MFLHEEGKAGGPVVASKPVERHHALDLIRGLAALAVSQYHFMHWNGIAEIESMGTFAVYMFFALSGLTMMMVYGDRFARGIEPEQLSSFFRNRYARLLPLLLLVAALAYAKSALTGNGDAVSAVMTGTGLMALHMPGFLSNTVGAWSLGIELAFYAVFPVIAVLARSWKAVAIWLIALLAAQHLLLWRLGTVEQHWHYYVSNLTFAPFFALGILASFDRGSKHSAMLVPTLAGLAMIAAFSLFVRTDLMRDQLSYFALTILTGGVIWAAWRSETPKWLVRPATFLGDISYSLYLTHWIANDIVRLFDVPISVRWGAYLIIAVTGAYASYRLFEGPARDALRRHG